MPILSKLSDKQIKRREFLESLFRRRKKDKSKKFCITVSRCSGSGGRLIAQQAAKKLRFKYYDKKIVDLIVKRANKRKELIQSLDEKSLGFLEETVGAIFGAKMVSSSVYFRHLVKTMLAITHKENCLILGRGANFIVPLENTLRVRISAPLRTRIENSIEYEGNSRKKAKAEVKRIDLNRKNFVKKYFRKDIANANYYDLVVNTRHITVNQATKIVIKAFRRGSL